MELSGTSMSSAVAAGAAALLLEARPLTPAEAKVLLQFTSSRVAGSGLLEAGAREPEHCRRQWGRRGDRIREQQTIADEAVTPSRHRVLGVSTT